MIYPLQLYSNLYCNGNSKKKKEFDKHHNTHILEYRLYPRFESTSNDIKR